MNLNFGTPLNAGVFRNLMYTFHYDTHTWFAKDHDNVRRYQSAKHNGTPLTDEQNAAMASALGTLKSVLESDLNGAVRLEIKRQLLMLVDSSDQLLIANAEVAQKQYELQQLMERRQQQASGFPPQQPAQGGNLPPWHK